MSPSVQRRIRNVVLPYQLKSIGLMHHFIAREFYSTSENLQLRVINSRGLIVVTGNHTALSNPVLEVGVLHCRVLLEFLGLRFSKSGKLSQRTSKSRRDDVWLCDLSTPKKKLINPTPSELLKALPHPRKDKLAALKLAWLNANKGMAHLTTGPRFDKRTLGKLSLACELLAEAVGQLLYDELGVARPRWQPPLTKRTN